MIKKLVVSAMLLAAITSSSVAADWQMKQARIMTKWSESIDPQNVLPEYPRPQMVRQGWANLNGVWDFGKFTDMNHKATGEGFDKKILVPFPMESAISGIMDTNIAANKGKIFGYNRSFEIPKAMAGKQILLHFGAVDWKAVVYVNGKKAGEHKGGFDPFYFDITDCVDKNSSSQQLQVFVQDFQEAGGFLHGKQKTNEKTIWYTTVTGIWQTVWIEAVAAIHVDKLTINPDIDKKQINICVASAKATPTTKATIYIYDSGKVVSTTKDVAVGKNVAIDVKTMKLWSPDSPFLYDLKIELTDNGKTVDSVDSYFGMRKIALGTLLGKPCIMLNNKPIFQHGVLDQGFWPDGIYTAPSDEALKYDLVLTKEFGMNMTRKHIKVEPARWYYHCDKLGLLVWQDIPNAGSGKDGKLIGEQISVRDNFNQEMVTIMESLENHPSIVLWTVFNESWGQPNQMESERSFDVARAQDPTRLISIASGWNDSEYGDIKDTHWYPEPNILPNPVNKRASVCGEYGGITLQIKGHQWIGGSKMSYTAVATSREFTDKFIGMIRSIQMMQADGMCASVYTQITDVEDEENGLITYDRKVLKMTPEQKAEIRAAVERNYTHTTKTVVPISQSKEVKNVWQYITTKSEMKSDNWAKAGFDTAGWKTGKAGFGSVIKDYLTATEWNTPYIYMRRMETFSGITSAQASKMSLRIFHDEDCVVYINGVCAAALKGYTNSYVVAPISPEALATIKVGKPNLIAVSCSQTVGGQFIDLGFCLTDVPK